MIRLPWPTKEVWPNFRQSHHWRTYAGPVKTQREEAFWLTKEAKIVPPTGDGPININVEFYPPDRRHRDDDGMIGAFKSARDGIAEALGVNDRRFRPVYWFMEPVKGGHIIVRVQENEAKQVGDALGSVALRVERAA